MKIKNILRNALVSAALLAGMGSCTIETSDNGDLDGFWHLEAVDTLATGGHLDLKDSKVFWAVQMNLMHVQGYDERFYFRFRQTGDSLVINSPFVDHWHEDNGEEGGDLPVSDVNTFSMYGINALEEPFYKEKLTGSKMILRSATLRLYFTKF